MINQKFWQGKKVFLTGHTGFKGAWLSLWLTSMGAEVTGYALNPSTNPSLYHLCRLHEMVHSVIGDIRDQNKLNRTLITCKPDIVIHMAAQPLVRDSYLNPVQTYEVNVMGTVHLLEAVRQARQQGINIQAFINVTTDKCYENKEWCWGYRESDPLGGHDPYSSSKACSELVTAAYRSSYFMNHDDKQSVLGIATARAGNVIGGGDWSKDRLIPDCTKAILDGREMIIRNPSSIRPWQHVLEPLKGYLMLAEKLAENAAKYSGAWNFGPEAEDCKSVGWIVEQLCEKWGGEISFKVMSDPLALHEANFLKLDNSKAKAELGWKPLWPLGQSLEQIVQWTKAYGQKEDMRVISLQQLHDYALGGEARGRS
ncbi:MAG TPA: CDP-glucose 4,6-dehydratase [Bacillus sp. (in: firmicutes)]|nr:CDP-glucose 4,6-dehydratase [Bacillus sp. (in: firmicutes)]